jgi:manganese efflux pump family protein
MMMHESFMMLTKILAIACAVGLDVFAISVSVGVARLPLNDSFKVGFAFAGSEIAMQVIGYLLGSGAGRLLGEIAVYAGIVLLGLIGLLMIRSSRRTLTEAAAGGFKPTEGAGLLMTALSVSLDSLGVGIALPGVSIPLVPLLITISISTTVFTLIGLAFGARLGERYERRAEFAGGAMLVVLAGAFALEHVM